MRLTKSKIFNIIATEPNLSATPYGRTHDNVTSRCGIHSRVSVIGALCKSVWPHYLDGEGLFDSADPELVRIDASHRLAALLSNKELARMYALFLVEALDV